MSPSQSQPFEINHELDPCGAAPLTSDHSSPAGHPPDKALDAALRSVPLPQGLMTRLSLLAHTISEDAADPVDWLGC